MKIKTLTLSLSAITCLSAMTMAQAGLQEEFILNQLMAKLDSNRNGLVNLPELQTRWSHLFNEHDNDYDKQLNYAEFEAMIQSKRAKAKWLNNTGNRPAPAALFTLADTNRDQWVSYQEYIDQNRKAFRSVDSNKDSALSRGELKEAGGKL